MQGAAQLEQLFRQHGLGRIIDNGGDTFWDYADIDFLTVLEVMFFEHHLSTDRIMYIDQHILQYELATCIVFLGLLSHLPAPT